MLQTSLGLKRMSWIRETKNLVRMLSTSKGYSTFFGFMIRLVLTFCSTILMAWYRSFIEADPSHILDVLVLEFDIQTSVLYTFGRSARKFEAHNLEA
jgi:hypothetical protein